MHKSASHDGRSKRSITQAEADNCCAAASNQTQSSVAGSTFALTNVTAWPAIMVSVVPAPVFALQSGRAFVPLFASPVPRHLVFSVLLV